MLLGTIKLLSKICILRLGRTQRMNIIHSMGENEKLCHQKLHLDTFLKDEYEFIGQRKQNKNIGKNTLSLLIILKKMS